MGKINNYRELKVWQKGHQLVLNVYKLTNDYPRHELYGLVSQMRRAAVSVPANIAEGFKRFGKKDKVRFYNIAQGSLEELDYHLLLSKDLKYIEDKEEPKELLIDTKKLLAALIKVIK